MCKYCQKEDPESISSLYSKSYDDKLTSAKVSLNIREGALLNINAHCYDVLRKTQIGMTASFGIKYCPWCGRRLSEV